MRTRGRGRGRRCSALRLAATTRTTRRPAYCRASCVRGGETFEGGVTNGVEWYAVSGGMQDFNYLFTNCMEITLELSCVKKPGEDKLQAEWDNNKEALLSFIERARGAVRGIVTDAAGDAVAGAVRGIVTDPA